MSTQDADVSMVLLATAGCLLRSGRPLPAEFEEEIASTTTETLKEVLWRYVQIGRTRLHHDGEVLLAIRETLENIYTAVRWICTKHDRCPMNLDGFRDLNIVTAAIDIKILALFPTAEEATVAFILYARPPEQKSASFYAPPDWVLSLYTLRN